MAKKEVFYALRRGEKGVKERVKATGYRVEIGGFTFFIGGGSGCSWGVTEAKSGMLIGIFGKTRKEAMEKLQAFDLSRLEKFDLDKLHEDMMQLPEGEL